MNCGRCVGANQTLVGVMIILPISEAGRGGGLALPLIFLLPFSSVRRDRDAMR